MRNKLFTILTVFAVMFLAGNLNVEAKTLADMPERTYIIGTHEFTPGEAITTQKIMLAARTIVGNDLELEDMVILYKNVEGTWVNTTVGTAVPEALLPESVTIEFVNTIPITELIAQVKAQLQTEYEKFNSADYLAEDFTSLTAYKTAADTAIDSATTVEEATAAKTKAVTEMTAIKTKATLVAEAKAELQTKYETYNEKHYSSSNYTALTNHKTNGDNAIDAATTLADITTAKETAITNMSNVLTHPILNKTTNIGYASLSAAITGASDTDQIVLTRDMTGLKIAYNVTSLEKRLNLDLNGFKITLNSRNNLPFITIKSTGELVLSDSSAAKTGEISRTNGTLIQNLGGKLSISGGKLTAPTVIALFENNSSTTISGGVFNGVIASNGSSVGPETAPSQYTTNATLTISGGEFNQHIYLPGAGGVTTVTGGTFNVSDYTVFQIRAGSLSISGGTFTSNVDTATNASVVPATGSKDFKGVIAAVKPSGSNTTTAYASPIVVNITGGTFTNTQGEAIVVADQSDAANTNGITVNIGENATINGAIANYDKGDKTSTIVDSRK